VHPQVLEKLGWEFPVSVIEFDLQELFRDFK
jgi:phenylalanyl-tRNA synthetase beta subunit